jgi:DNA ligase-associated metallophosphoesterase
VTLEWPLPPGRGRAGTLKLLPDRAAFVPAAAALLIADAHLGKAQSFRRLGVPVPGGTTAANLARLSRLIAATGARSVVFLGDLLHARAARTPRLLDEVARWRRFHADVGMTLVRGNHDASAGDPPADWGIDLVDEPWPLPGAPGLLLCHHPQDQADAYVLAGHVHPAVVIGRGHDCLRLPCFLFGAHQGLLPAFGAFTGTHVVQPKPGERIFVCAGDELREVTPGA